MLLNLWEISWLTVFLTHLFFLKYLTWIFAYKDGNKKYLPKVLKGAIKHQKFTQNIWKDKYRIITEVYGFEKTRFEAKTTAKTEAFWKFIRTLNA